MAWVTADTPANEIHPTVPINLRQPFRWLFLRIFDGHDNIGSAEIEIQGPNSLPI
jgi:hypothetical protein